MLVCHCNVISQKEIEEVITGLLDRDPWQVIVPGMVFRELSQRGKCCGCLPGIVDTITKVSLDYHRTLETPPHRIVSLNEKMIAMRTKMERKRHARGQKGHRAA